MNFQQDEMANLIRLVDQEVTELTLMRGDLVDITRMGDSIDELRAAERILWYMSDRIDYELSPLMDRVLAIIIGTATRIESKIFNELL